jgi:hypothetical protein
MLRIGVPICIIIDLFIFFQKSMKKKSVYLTFVFSAIPSYIQLIYNVQLSFTTQSGIPTRNLM